MQDVPAGIAAVVLAAGPLLTLLLAVAHTMERLSVRALVGALAAIAGSVVIFFQPGTITFGWESRCSASPLFVHPNPSSSRSLRAGSIPWR
jgi:drug/metabolite transporter (DMT)-like permease